MDKKNGRRATPGRVRTVKPFGDADNMAVDLVELSDGEQAAILDRHGYMPGRKDATAAKLNRVTRDTVLKRITGWDDYTADGAPVEVNDKAKLDFLIEMYVVDSEEKSLWQLCVEAEQRQKEDEEKN